MWSTRVRGYVFALAVAVVWFSSAHTVVAQDALTGAWVMQTYTGGGSIGPATGQLIVADGRFALIYRMTAPSAAPSGRAHGGTYTLQGTDLIFHVVWSMDHVSGKGSVAADPSDRRVKAVVRGDQLTLTFENGAVQTFTRARLEAHDSTAVGGWHEHASD
jgi:hypothetical protein